MILMVMNISLTGVVVLVIRKNEGFQYAGYRLSDLPYGDVCLL